MQMSDTLDCMKPLLAVRTGEMKQFEPLDKAMTPILKLEIALFDLRLS
jgi:hypothetical protein